MKLPPALARVQERMARGVLARDGFLGNDTRNLADIVAEDAEALAHLDVRAEDLGRALERLGEAALAALGGPVVVDGRYEVRAVEVMGRMPCPFGRCGLFPKAEVRGRRLDTGQELLWTPLGAHLIGAHGFFQGRGSPYRVEPGALAEFLGLGRKRGGGRGGPEPG